MFDGERAVAFNLGCDARLRGDPAKSCPYQLKSILATFWQQGWLHVHNHWGELAMGIIRKLTKVRNVA